jgi:hypothetical protein
MLPLESTYFLSFPLRAKFCSTLERAVRVIVTVWIIAFVAALPTVFIVVINKLPIPEWVHIHAPELISSVSKFNY